jgi:hypothetical protein
LRLPIAPNHVIDIVEHVRTLTDPPPAPSRANAEPRTHRDCVSAANGREWATSTTCPRCN